MLIPISKMDKVKIKRAAETGSPEDPAPKQKPKIKRKVGTGFRGLRA